MKSYHYITLIFISVFTLSCGVYSFTGLTPRDDLSTFQVNYFQNNAALIEPGLDRDFTLELQDLILNQTNLDLVKTSGDLVYEGEIVEYVIDCEKCNLEEVAEKHFEEYNDFLDEQADSDTNYEHDNYYESLESSWEDYLNNDSGIDFDKYTYKNTNFNNLKCILKPMVIYFNYGL